MNNVDNIVYYWDMLTDRGIATTEEILLVLNVTDIDPFQDLLNILYARTGLTSFDQLLEEEEEK